ncbi:MAG: hypothetical protein ABSH08_08535 [Tepidisphaeraceae bacterium]|jgi:anti-sigma factor RsiW
MDKQTLERLMIDEALGALEPDVSLLLSAYCETLSNCDAELAAWQRVAAGARAAMPEQATEELPPFAAPVRLSRPWRLARIGVSIAAVLAIGVGIGLRMAPQPSHPPQSNVTVQSTTTEMPRSAGVSDFWSSQRLMASAQQPERLATSTWHWTSPIAEPEIGETK